MAALYQSDPTAHNRDTDQEADSWVFIAIRRLGRSRRIHSNAVYRSNVAAPANRRSE